MKYGLGGLWELEGLAKGRDLNALCSTLKNMYECKKNGFSMYKAALVLLASRFDIRRDACMIN